MIGAAMVYVLDDAPDVADFQLHFLAGQACVGEDALLAFRRY